MTNIFKELKNSKGIFDDLDKNTLRSVIKSFNNTSMSVDDLAQKFGGLNTETITYLKSAKRGEASLEGLSASMTSASISTKLLSVALNALSGLAISLIIKGFTWALDELIVTLDEQKQKLDEAVTAYEESKSELEQINDELKTTGERIDELNDKENLTFTEQDELEKLIKTNDELERKIYLLEQANKEAEKEVATEAQNTYDKYTNDRTIGAVEQIDFYADSSLLEGVSWNNFKGDLSWLVAQYKNQQEILTNAQANGWTQIEEQTKSNLELLEGYMSDASLNYQDLYDKISGISDYAMTDELKVAKQDLDDILDIVAEILGYGGQRSETSFDNIWNSEDFSQYKTELETLAKEGKLDASVLESNENYKKLLEDTGTTAEDTAQHINALVDEIGKTGQEANKIDVSLDDYKKASEGISSLATAFKELTDSEYVSIDTISKIKEAVGDSVSNWDEYEQKLLSVKKGTAEYNQLMRELTYATLEKQLGGVKALANADEKYVTQLLKENGVLNANEVAHGAVERAKAKELVQSKTSNQETVKTIESLIQEANSAGISTNAYLELTAKEILFNNNTLDTSQKCQQILAIASAVGVASTAYDTLTNQINAWASKDLLGSGTRTKTATDLGMTVINESNRGKDGNGKGNLYVASDGKEFENYKDAMYYQESLNNVQKISDAYSNTNFVLPDYSGTGKSGGSSKETKETFDWIEIAISRLQRTITNLGKTVSATWKSWTDRNSALKSQISVVTQEINKQQQAYNKYMSLANSVGLDPYYQSLVQNGAMDISTITDETLAEQIKTYQDYFEKALAAKDATIDLQDELANLARTEFDNVAKQFDSEISLVEQNISTIESYIDQVEMKGNLTSKNLYSTMYEEESKNLSLLQQKYEKLSDTLSNGTIKQNSEEWNSMAVEVKEVKQAIIESTTALEEYQKTMRELDWEVFDLIQDKISNVISESEDWIELLSNSKLFDDDGSITSQGQATLGLHVANLRVYENQVNDYAKAIKDLDTQFANDSLDKDYLERRQELLELQRESILNCESEKGAIKDLMNEGFDSLLSYMDELISKRKELLSQASDTRSFQKSVQEQTSEISRLQNILNSYNGDLSEEAKASIQKYEVELKEAESNLEDTLYDQYISDQEKMLDTLADATEQWINTRLDNIDGLIQDVVTSVDNNSSSIEETLKNEVSKAGGILSTEMQNIWSSNDNLTSITDGVNNTLLDIKNLVEKLVDTSVVDTSTLTQTQGWNQNSDGTWNYRNASGENVTGWHKLDWNGKQDWYSFDENGTMRSNQWIHNDSGTWSYVNGSGAAVTGWQNLNWQGKNDWYAFDSEGNMQANQWIGDYFVGSGGQMLTDTWVGHNGMYYYVGSDGKWLNLPSWTSNGRPNDGYPIYEYAKGSKRIPFDQLARLGEKGQELKYDKSNGTLSLVGEGDMVWTNEQTKRLWELSKTINPVMPNIQMPNFDFSKITPNGGNTDIGDITFDIKMYGVNDPQEMAQQVKKIYQDNLGDVRKTIRADVYGGMLGKNSLTRYKY